MPLRLIACGLAFLVALPLAGGCGSRTAAPPAPRAAHGHGHDHGHADHDHPETLAEGVAELKTAAADVKAHLAAGKADEADGVVHGIGHLIEDLQGLLPKEKLSAEGKTAAAKALDEIFTAFDELDTALHAPKGKGDSPAEVHARLSQRIEEAIAALEAAR